MDMGLEMVMAIGCGCALYNLPMYYNGDDHGGGLGNDSIYGFGNVKKRKWINND